MEEREAADALLKRVQLAVTFHAFKLLPELNGTRIDPDGTMHFKFDIAKEYLHHERRVNEVRTKLTKLLGNLGFENVLVNADGSSLSDAEVMVNFTFNL